MMKSRFQTNIQQVFYVWKVNRMEVDVDKAKTEVEDYRFDMSSVEKFIIVYAVILEYQYVDHTEAPQINTRHCFKTTFEKQ